MKIVDCYNLLIVGETGSGKLACLKSIMADLMKRYSPENLKFLIYDEKQVEFKEMIDSPYLLKPIIKEPADFRRALEELKLEVEKRFQMYIQKGMRAQVLQEPKIVVVADEFNAFMTLYGEDAEGILTFLFAEGAEADVGMLFSTSRYAIDAIKRLSKSVQTMLRCSRGLNGRHEYLLFQQGDPIIRKGYVE